MYTHAEIPKTWQCFSLKNIGWQGLRKISRGGGELRAKGIQGRTGSLRDLGVFIPPGGQKSSRGWGVRILGGIAPP